MPDDIERTLGRIEQKVDDMRKHQDHLFQAIFNGGGLESRIRANEKTVAVLKNNMQDVRADTKRASGIIATLVAAVV